MNPVAGHDQLENTIRWVVSTEHLEAGTWLRGGEFILIYGWNLRPSKSAMVRYIEHLQSIGIAGLGFAIGVHHQSIPEPILETAERLNFPVCAVPYELAFGEFARSAAEFLFSEKQAHLSAKDLFNSDLVNDIISSKIDINDLIVRISSTLLCSAYFIDDIPRILAKSTIYTLPQTNDISKQSKTRIPVFNRISLELHCDRENLNDAHMAFIAEMVFAAKIYFSRNLAVKQERMRVETDFLRNLAIGNMSTEQVASRLSALGLDPSMQQTAIVIRDAVYPFRLCQKTEEIFIKHNISFITSRRKLSVEYLIDPSKTIKLNNLITALATALPSATIGIGRTVDVHHLKYSLQQARYLARSNSKGVFRPDMLGVSELLMMLDKSAVEDFISRAIGLNKNDNLIDSIEVLLDCGFNINEAAEKLKIHRHTLRYKIERFVEETQHDIRIPDIRYQVWMAIKMYRNTQQMNISSLGT